MFMNLKQFKYVLTLARSESFAKAADSLNISQPSLSQYVKKIEQQLGVELFDRTGGTVRLTDAGRIYIEAGRKILDLERQMYGQFNDLAEYKTGSIVVGTSPYRCAAMMPLVAKQFQTQYPGMYIVVEEMTSQELIDNAAHGQFDLCLTMLPLDERKFCYEKITEEELILVVPSDYPPLPAVHLADRKYPAIDTGVIDHQPMIMITENQWMQQALDQIAVDYRLSFRRAAVVKSLEAQIAMVRAGVGMALLPSGIERFCAPGEVTCYSFAQQLPKREVVVMWQKERCLNQVTQDLIGTMKKILW